MSTKDEVRSTVEALIVALEALEETRNALAWFYDSYPQDVTKKGNELLPHVETVLTTIRAALASKSEALAEDSSGTEQPAQPRGEATLSQRSVKPWRGLTDEEIETSMPGGIYDCLADPWDCGVGDGDEMRSIKKDVVRIARAVEAKLKEKNGF